MSTLAARAGVPAPVIDAIKQIESSGNSRAVRFETRLFRERTGRTVEGSSRTAFQTAFNIDPRAAVESSSWGLYQVLGGALLRLYGPSPAAAVAAFDRAPDRVSEELLVEWFRGRPAAQEAARRGDWPELARLYNGSSTSPWLGRFLRALEAGQAHPGGTPATIGVIVGGAFLLFGAGMVYLTTRVR